MKSCCIINVFLSQNEILRVWFYGKENGVVERKYQFIYNALTNYMKQLYIHKNLIL